MQRQEIIQRLCKLLSEVMVQRFQCEAQTDCICGENPMSDTRQDSQALEYIEQVVNTALLTYTNRVATLCDLKVPVADMSVNAIASYLGSHDEPQTDTCPDCGEEWASTRAGCMYWRHLRFHEKGNDSPHPDTCPDCGEACNSKGECVVDCYSSYMARGNEDPKVV